jgi:hypothetical protein
MASGVATSHAAAPQPPPPAAADDARREAMPDAGARAPAR